MPDPRFYHSAAPLSLTDAATLTGARLSGHELRDFQLAAPLNRADETAVSFVASARRLDDLASTRAGAVFTSQALAAKAPEGCLTLITEHPHAAWSQIAARLHCPIHHDPAGDLIHASVQLETDVALGRNVVLGQGVRIGRGSYIAPGAVIGPGVTIGRNCVVGPGATIGFALIGDRVSIAAGARIGEAGFGVATGPNGPVDVPQLGRVILQDGVTIGANSCVDRGAWDDTAIGENTKIDNLCHIAHNVVIGRNCRLAAFTGISGSVKIGDGVFFGGKAGVADQIVIGDGAAIGASASVFKDVPAGETWTGYPARPLRQWLRENATLARMSRTRKRAGDEQD